MKRNVLPFGIIAIVGIFVAVIVFYIGVHQRADIQAEQSGETGEETEEMAASEPEEIYANKCSSCHGDDLSGEMVPDLTKVGADLSVDEIEDVIVNGKGSMPPGLAVGEETKALAEWLSEHQ